MMKHNLDKLGNISLGNAEKEAIGAFLSSLEDKKIADKLKIPCDFVLKRVNEEQT